MLHDTRIGNFAGLEQQGVVPCIAQDGIQQADKSSVVVDDSYYRTSAFHTIPPYILVTGRLARERCGQVHQKPPREPPALAGGGMREWRTLRRPLSLDSRSEDRIVMQ
jgi:hypothetical protein